MRGLKDESQFQDIVWVKSKNMNGNIRNFNY